MEFGTETKRRDGKRKMKTREISRIEPMLVEFKKLWEKHPELRFGQLVCNIMPEDKLYYVEDAKRTWLETAMEDGFIINKLSTTS